METVEFYNFSIHKDIYFLISSIKNMSYSKLYFDEIGEMSIDFFAKCFSNFEFEVRNMIDDNDKYAKGIARYIILTYRDRVCTFDEMQEKVCDMSKTRFLEMYDKAIEDLKTKIFEL